MQKQNVRALTPKSCYQSLILFTGVASIIALTSLPTLARFYPRYSLFQPYASRNYPYRSSKNTLANTLAQDTKFANLTAELQEAGLLETLKGKGSFTIFAPSDEAFKALPEEVFQKFSQPENRIRVLKYHLVSREITPDDVNSGEIATLEGGRVKITQNDDGSVKLNDANAKHPSTLASNGVIIEVDRLLLPPDF
ncbi:MAG: fasciclin domain-containing protein [Cyanosarcina radialis HA8281-LM2]|jgi:uncharacterized surface protein with fasciclin (FAS1) repeats|nr:fasciclin domain-containing protein [Cyanosarcina radialis HA8281-LM2]